MFSGSVTAATQRCLIHWSSGFHFSSPTTSQTSSSEQREKTCSAHRPWIEFMKTPTTNKRIGGKVVEAFPNPLCNQRLTLDRMEPKSDPEVSRASEVEQAFVDLGNAQDQIEKFVTALRDRLQSVLRSEAPPASRQVPLPTGPTTYSAPLAQRIHNVSDNLNANVRLLEDVLSRLEV